MPKFTDVEGLIEVVEIAPWPDDPELLAVALHILPPPSGPHARKEHKKHLFLVEDSAARQLARRLLEVTKHLDSSS